MSTLVLKITEKRRNYNQLDLAGKQLGRLVAIREVGRNSIGSVLWLCECQCGRLVTVSSSKLKNGWTKSCGCLQRDVTALAHTTHGLSVDESGNRTRLYAIWGAMKRRCHNKKAKQYHDYGGRGIDVCLEWREDFASFYAWAMNSGYQDSLTIDRLDNNKGYYPDNCKWSTRKEQSLNRRSNIVIQYGGIREHVSWWASVTGIKAKVLKQRLLRGWSTERTISQMERVMTCRH